MHLNALGTVTTADAQNMVTAIFQKDFGRTPAASGLSFWVSQLQNNVVNASNLEATILADASAADLAYYHSLSTQKTAPAPAPVPAPKSSNLTTQANINAEAAANPNAIIMTPGVSDYAAIQKTVLQDVGQSGGEVSIAQGWVSLTGHTDQWWQEVQAAYTAGKSPTPTTFPDPWLSSVSLTPAILGSPQAIANMKPALPAYIQFLKDLGTPDSTITAELASKGINQSGQAISIVPIGAPAAQMQSVYVPTPTPAPRAPAPTQTPAQSVTNAAAGVYGAVAGNQAPAPAAGPGYSPIAAPAPTPAPSTTAASTSPITTSQSFTLPSSGGSYTPGGGYTPPAPTPTPTPGTAGIGGISPIELGVLAVGAYLLMNRKR